MSAFSVFAFGSAIEGFLFGGPYRPPNWNKPQKYSMTCTLPPPTSVTSSSTVNGQAVPEADSANPSTPTQSATTYFFDAVLRAEYVQDLICTEHPVQVGSAVVDHAYLRPSRVILEVLMSDAVASYQNGQYSSSNSRSISAYQTFLQVQAARVPITLATKLNAYQNMVIESIRATDDLRTVHGGRFTIFFRQIISAQVSMETVSARPFQTDTTNEGTKSTQTPDAAQHQALLDSVPQPAENPFD